jgi:N-acetylmuramoyl-L-alanine amidase
MTRKIDKHIIHCSDSIFGNAEAINSWHKERGFNEIGYHFVIRRDGQIEMGRMPSIKGAHCKAGGNNTGSIGTCLIGKEHFEEVQFESLRKLHAELKEWFPQISAHPHNEFDDRKTCPNFDVSEVLKCLD